MQLNCFKKSLLQQLFFDAIYGGGDECEFIECLDFLEGYKIVETEEEKVIRLFDDYQKGISVFCDKNSNLKDCWSSERLTQMKLLQVVNL